MFKQFFQATAEAGKRLGGGIKTLNGKVVNPVGAMKTHPFLQASTQFKIQGAFLGYTLFMSRGTPEEKVHAAATQIGTFLMTAGMKSGWRQAAWQIGLALAPNFPDMARGLVQGYRGVLEARTMASVPFSYSTLNIDQAWSSMQYAQSRLNDSYSTLGSEAAMFHARYMQR